MLRQPPKSTLKQQRCDPAIPVSQSAILIARTASLTTPSPRQTPSQSTLVSATKEKRRILDQYERDFGYGYPDSIITKKKGKNDPHSFSVARMRPALNKYYRIEEVTFHNVITIVMRDYATFSPDELKAIRLLDKDFSIFVPKVLHWLKVDFSPLREPRYHYQDQTLIDPRRVLMANAAMVHFGLDPGRFVCWLAGEYTGCVRDVQATLAVVWNYISDDDYDHMKRILLEGCPYELQFDEPLDNKLEMIRRGNSRSFKDNIDLVLKTMNKEDRYSHVLPLDELLCTFSPYCRHTM